MILLKYVFKLIELFNSETSASSLAAGLALGTALGFIPVLSLQWVLLLWVVLFLRVNLTTTLFTVILFKLVSFGMTGVFDAIGDALLGADGLKGTWSAVVNAPGMWLCFLNHTVTLGATLVSLALIPALFFGGRFAITRYRRHVLGYVRRTRLVGAIKGFKAYKWYRRAVSPLL